MKAYINDETKPGTLIRFVRRMREKGKEIVSAGAAYGRFAVILVIETETGGLDEIVKIVYKIVQSDPGVICSETSIALGTRNRYNRISARRRGESLQLQRRQGNV